MYLIEEEFKKYDIEISFTRLLGEALFVTNAFTFYEGCSPYTALYGRQPACLPDFETPERRAIRRAGIDTGTDPYAMLWA